MNLVLLRHGIAIDRDAEACPADPERWLTDRGLDRTAAAVAGLGRVGLRPDVVLSSPWRRATETAELARRALAPELTTLTSEAFVPAGSPSAAAGVLAGLGSVEEVLCAGHAPQLDRLLAWLVGAPRPFTALKKAGAAWLDVWSLRPGGAALVWLLAPRQLRQLGGAAS